MLQWAGWVTVVITGMFILVGVIKVCVGILGGGVTLSPLVLTASPNRPVGSQVTIIVLVLWPQIGLLYQLQNWSSGGMKAEVVQENPVPVPFCPSHILHGFSRDRPQASTG
jgi:hypothetical protein